MKYRAHTSPPKTHCICASPLQSLQGETRYCEAFFHSVLSDSLMNMEVRELRAANFSQTIMNNSILSKNVVSLMSENDDSYRFSNFYLTCLMLIATIGCISNLSSAKYTFTSFTLSKSIYLVLFFDSIVTFVGFLGIQGMLKHF